MLTYNGVGTIFVGVEEYRIRSTNPKHPAHSAAAYCVETDLDVKGTLDHGVRSRKTFVGALLEATYLSEDVNL